MAHSNQRTIVVKRTSLNVRKDYYKISTKNLHLAMYNLPGNAFKLYCYLCNNQHDYQFDLYPCDFERICHVSKDTYLSAFNKLVEKGYLKPSEKTKDLYFFKEEGEKAEQIPQWEDKIKVVDKEEFDRMLEDEK